MSFMTNSPNHFIILRECQFLSSCFTIIREAINKEMTMEKFSTLITP